MYNFFFVCLCECVFWLLPILNHCFQYSIQNSCVTVHSEEMTTFTVLILLSDRKNCFRQAVFACEFVFLWVDE